METNTNERNLQGWMSRNKQLEDFAFQTSWFLVGSCPASQIQVCFYSIKYVLFNYALGLETFANKNIEKTWQRLSLADIQNVQSSSSCAVQHHSSSNTVC